MKNNQTITINNHTLSYTTAGPIDAPPIIMIHGWFSYKGVWQQSIELLKDCYYCVAVDLLGFGDSAKPKDGDYSIKAQGNRILHLADILGFEQFTLLGHSMGGQISLCIGAILAPQRVTKLISVAGVVAAKLTPDVERTIYPSVAVGFKFPWLYRLLPHLINYSWYVRFNFKTWFYNLDAIPDHIWAVDRQMATQFDMVVSAYRAGQAIHNFNLTPHLANITAPTLAIFGQQDNVVPVSDGHLVKQHVPNSQLILIDHCGHFPMYEKPKEYLAGLKTFL